MNDIFLYLYCVTNAGPYNNPLMTGIGGKDIHCLEYDNIKIWFGETDKTCINCSLENLKIHNRVSMELMVNHTVIPFKYGTVVKDKNRLYLLVDKLYLHLNENINRLCGKYEVGVKVFGEMSIAGKFDYYRLPAVEKLMSVKSRQDSMNYFIDRIRMYEEEKLKEQGLEDLKDILLSELISLSDDYRIMNMNRNKLLINSAFLIEKDNIKIFEEKFDSIKANNPGYSFLFSGPWPPYNFVDITMEGE